MTSQWYIYIKNYAFQKAGRGRKEVRVEFSPENWVKCEQKEEMYTWWG